MIGTVGIKEAVFAVRFTELANATWSLLTTDLDTSGLSYESTVLDKYVDLFQELTEAVRLYKSLVQQDSVTIRTVAESYLALDEDIMSIWRVVQ